MTLAALVTALMLALSPRAAHTRDGQQIARAITVAVSEDEARGYADAPLLAASMVLAAYKESRFTVHPRPVSWDAVAHRSCGPWQIACAYADTHSVLDQARRWLVLVHQCGLSCVSPGPRQARARLVMAMGLVGRVSAEGIAERQGASRSTPLPASPPR